MNRPPLNKIELREIEPGDRFIMDASKGFGIRLHVYTVTRKSKATLWFRLGRDGFQEKSLRFTTWQDAYAFDESWERWLDYAEKVSRVGDRLSVLAKQLERMGAELRPGLSSVMDWGAPELSDGAFAAITVLGEDIGALDELLQNKEEAS